MQMTGWVGVRDRVEQLSLRTSSAKVFGADHHLFHLAAPLSAAELSQVEQQLGVTFPQEYRTFLTEVAPGARDRSTASSPHSRSRRPLGLEL